LLFLEVNSAPKVYSQCHSTLKDLIIRHRLGIYQFPANNGAILMSSTKETSDSPGKAKPITTTRVPDVTEMSSPLDSFLMSQKRKRGNSCSQQEDGFKEMSAEEQEEEPEK